MRFAFHRKTLAHDGRVTFLLADLTVLRRRILDVLPVQEGLVWLVCNDTRNPEVLQDPYSKNSCPQS